MGQAATTLRTRFRDTTTFKNCTKTVGRPQSLEAAKADGESLLTKTGGNEYGKRKKTREQTEQKI